MALQLKKILLLGFLIPICVTTCFSQHTWYWYNPIGDSYNIKDIFVNSINDVWASGEGGKLIHFDGQQWSMLERLTWCDLNALWFTDANHGWAVGGGGVILRYEDGTWSMINSGNTKRLHDLFFTSENNGWAVGEARRHYIDGQWITIDTVGYNGVTDLFFTDENHGWAGGSDKMYRYDTAGWHWAPLPFSDYYSVKSIFFLDSIHGWLGGYYSDFTKMIMEYNGTGWKLSAYHPPIISNDLYFDTPTHGWSCGDPSMFQSTTYTIWEYTGTTWESSYANHNVPNTLAALNASDLYVGTEYGHILYHDSLGWHFSNTLTEGATMLSFPDTGHGWAVGEGKEILRYRNGLWGIDTSFSGKVFNHIHFADTAHGIASAQVTDSNVYAIYRYSDGIWHLLTSTVNTEIMSVFCLSSGDAWFSGFNSTGGRILKLSNNIITDTTFSDLNWINGICFPNQSQGWAIGASQSGINCKILRCVNDQWYTQKTLPTWSTLNSISFADPFSGWAVGYNYNSRSGISWRYNGQQWIEGPGFSPGLISVYHPDPDHAYAVGGNKIFTLNYGVWQEESITINQGLVSISFPSEEIGWIAGDNGAILSSLSPYPVHIPEPSGQSGSGSLSVYPNPAIDLLNIKINLPVEPYQLIEIEIFDLYGQLVFSKEVRNVINKTEIDISTWPRSIYVVRLLRNKEMAANVKIMVE